MNNSDREHYDDEIDLFEIVEIMWQGQWIIVATVVLAMTVACAYVANKKVIYKYTLPYSAITAPNPAAFEYFLTQSVIFSPVEKIGIIFSGYQKTEFITDNLKIQLRR